MIAPDKQKHFAAGLAIAIMVGLLFCPPIGLGTAILAGFWKEWRDKRTGKGRPEWLDLLATVLGGVLGSVGVHVLIEIVL